MSANIYNHFLPTYYQVSPNVTKLQEPKQTIQMIGPTIVGKFLENILAKIAISAGGKLLNKVIQADSFQLFKREKYLKTVEKTLNQMPFLYQEVESDVLRDFIDINIQKVDVVNFKPLGTINDEAVQTKTGIQRLKEETKVLIVGNAGIGKTTLLRHTVLNIINKRKTSYFNTTKKKQFIPIFVPLKAIKNVRRSPIVNYIIENHSYFSGEAGLKRLTTLAENRRLFVALDGYDEISFLAKETFLQDELRILLSPDYFISDLAYDSRYTTLYRSMTKSKIWLSSREEFYLLNPLTKPTAGSIKPYDNTFAALKITGLGNNRIKFVKRIFDTYKSKSAVLAKLLDEEQFVENIDTTYDQDLIALSKIPLFLTIMCYLYVNKTEDEGRVIENLLTEFVQIVKECVVVMLADLDKYKVRNLPDGQREAFKKRRNAYPNEKKEFLNIFSLSLLVDSLNVFTEDYLKEKVIEHFSERSNSINAAKIVNEYITPESNNPNFSFQLLYSGLFVVSGVEKGKYVYDFPHRRFKEILALESLDAPENLKLFHESLKSKGLGEFVLLVFEKERFRTKTFEALLKHLLTDEDDKYIFKLLSKIVNKHQNLGTEIGKTFEAFLTELWTTKNVCNIPKELFKKVQFSTNFHHQITIALKNEETCEIKNLLLQIMKEVWYEEYQKLLLDQMISIAESNKLSAIDQVFIQHSFIEALADNEEIYERFERIPLQNNKQEEIFSILQIKTKPIIPNSNYDFDKLIIPVLNALLITSKNHNTNKLDKIIKSILFNVSITNSLLLVKLIERIDANRYASFLLLTDFFVLRELFNHINQNKSYESFLRISTAFNENEKMLYFKNSYNEAVEKMKKGIKVPELELKEFQSRYEINNNIITTASNITENEYTYLVKFFDDVDDGNYNFLSPSIQ